MNSLSNPFVASNFFGTSYAPKSHLSYSLIPVENGAIFQIHEQSNEVTAFLKKGYFQASNGLRVAIAEFPEFKDSKNVVYLRGTDKSSDLKVDRTRFISNPVRDSKIAMVNEALAELVNTVKKSIITLRPRTLAEELAAMLNNPFNSIKVIEL